MDCVKLHHEITRKVLDRKIRIGAVSYLNTKPLIFGLEKEPVAGLIELVLDYPANVAAMLANDRIDIGLLPVAMIDRIPGARVIGDVCIACDGAVDSVAIFSEMPLEKIQTILLDYQSRTSVALARILLRDFWKQEVEWVPAGGEDFRSRISGTTAGVVIGDRALEQKKRSAYMYDLGTAWKTMTGLPFVFACWVANKPIEKDFISLFNKANREGFAHLPEVISRVNNPVTDLQEYYTHYIHYELDEQKQKGMELFSSLLRTL